MILRTFVPCLQLQPYVKRYSFINDEGLLKGIKLRTISDGGSELIINMGSPCVFNNPFKKKEVSLNINLCGQFINQQFVSLTGNTHVLSIDFRHGGILSVFGIPQCEFQSNQVSLSDINRTSYNYLMDKIMEHSEYVQKINIIENFLITQLKKQKRNQFPIARNLDYLENCTGLADVKNLACYQQLTYRTLDRKFNLEIGVSPKQYMDIVRLNRISRYIQQNPELDWQNIVYLFNFSDQSHLIKFFKKLTGFTPNEFKAKQKNGLSYLGKITLEM